MSNEQTGATDPTTGDEALAALQAQLNDAVKERDEAKSKLRGLGKVDDDLKTLRAELQRVTTEKSTLHDQFESFKQTVKTKEIETHVSTALDAAGAQNPATVKKLLDMNKIKFNEDGSIDPTSISEMIGEIQKTDSYLFKEAQKTDPKPGETSTTTTTQRLPDVKAAAQGEKSDAFKAALEAAKKAKDPFKAIEEVMTQFQKQ